MKNKSLKISVVLTLVVCLVTPINSLKDDYAYNEEQKYPVEKSPLVTRFNVTFAIGDRNVGHYVQQTTDGGYIITGYTGSFVSTSTSVWLIKTDKNGLSKSFISNSISDMKAKKNKYSGTHYTA